MYTLISSLFSCLLFMIAAIAPCTQAKAQPVTIHFYESNYNLLFTQVEINGRDFTALIDFGDFASLQLSDKLVAELNLTTEASDFKMYDIEGKEYFLQSGVLPMIQIGNGVFSNLDFFTSNGEIAAVSQQVGTDFQLVIGIGLLINHSFLLDFQRKHLIINPEKNQIVDAKKGQPLPVKRHLGYLIVAGEVENKPINFLFDTGSPLSQIEGALQLENIAQSTVSWQGTIFPTISLPAFKDTEISLVAEVADLQHIEALGASGIIGVNDMLGKVFYFDHEEAVVYCQKS